MNIKQYIKYKINYFLFNKLIKLFLTLILIYTSILTLKIFYPIFQKFTKNI